MSQRWLYILIIVLFVNACSSPTARDPGPDPNPDAPPPVLALQIDPASGVVTILSQALSPQQLEQVQIGNNDFKLDNFEVEILAGNRLIVLADFINSPRFPNDPTGTRESKEILLPITFQQNDKTTPGIRSLSLPRVSEEDFGKASLLPDETVEGLIFEIQHFGESFEYYVDAFSKVQEINDCSNQAVNTYVIRNSSDAKKLENCVVLNANITIEDSDDIVDLDLSPLDSLRSLRGDLLIRKTQLVSTHFPSLQEISGDVTIRESNVRGFAELKRISGRLEFSRIDSLEGFTSLEEVAELVINNNNVDAFSNGFLSKLRFVRRIEISENPNFSNLSFLNALEDVIELIIDSNHKIEDDEVVKGGRFTSLEGLENLQSADRLQITNNQDLESITALEKLEFVGEGVISNNANLDCSLEVIKDGQDPYLPKFLPIAESTGNKVDCLTAPTGDFEVFRQEQLETFRGFETIDGNITIHFTAGGGPDRITNLKPLANLKLITGNLVLEGVSNTVNSFNLEGLEELETIGGDFRINFGDIVTVSLSPLSSLKVIAGTLKVTGGLTDFTRLKRVDRDRDEDPLSLGGLHIEYCAERTKPDGCGEANQQPVKVSSLKGLEDVVDLAQLTLIATDVQSVPLVRLKSVGSLRIEDNEELTNIVDLFSLDSVDQGVISFNEDLDCGLEPLPPFLRGTRSNPNPDLVDASEGNKVNCPTERTLFEDVVITNAADLEILKDIVVLEGSLTIQVLEGTITSLNDLSSLRHIVGNLTIGARPDQTALAPSNRGLSSLAGLENLSFVEGDVVIKRNQDLANITQLSSLSRVDGFSDISENAELDCSAAPLPPFLPVDFSAGNLINCQTKNPPYIIFPEQSAISVIRTETGLIDINISDRIAGFDEMINLSLDDNAVIDRVSFSPNPTTNQSELEFTVSPTATLGNTTLFIRGESTTTKAEASATVELTIVGSDPVVDRLSIQDNGTSNQARQGAGIIVELEGQQLVNLSTMALRNNRGLDIVGELAVDDTGTPIIPNGSSATLSFLIPHGVTGFVDLELATDSGLVSFPNTIEITAITAKADADASQARGTPDRPYGTIGEAFSKTEPGDTVMLLNGRFNVNTGETFPLMIPEGVQVEGEARDTTIIEGPNPDDRIAAVSFTGAGVLSGLTVERGFDGINGSNGGIVLDDLTVTGSLDGLYFDGTAQVVASNLTVTQTGNYGIFVTGTAEANASLTLSNSQISGHSIGVVITNSGSLNMSNTEVLNNSLWGVFLDATDATRTVLIADSKISGSALDGILVEAFNTAATTFTNLMVKNNGGHGVNFLGDNLTMTGTIVGNGGSQFFDDRPARDAADGSIVGLVGTILGSETCLEGVETGPFDNGLLKINHDNNRVNCFIPIEGRQP